MAIRYICTCSRKNVLTGELMVKIQALSWLMIWAYQAAGWEVEVGEMVSTDELE